MRRKLQRYVEFEDRRVFTVLFHIVNQIFAGKPNGQSVKTWWNLMNIKSVFVFGKEVAMHISAALGPLSLVDVGNIKAGVQCAPTRITRSILD